MTQKQIITCETFGPLETIPILGVFYNSRDRQHITEWRWHTVRAAESATANTAYTGAWAMLIIDRFAT